jgi:hypothetical protein
MILVIGPYVGNFEQEVLTFRPWARWLYDRVNDLSEFQQVYVHTHFNRFFMYRDFISDDYLIPVYENLTRNELGQDNYVHADIDNKDYLHLIRHIKDIISDKTFTTKKDIQVEHLNYAKYMPHMSIYKKLFSKINYPTDIWPHSEYKNKIVFIPSNECPKGQLHTIKIFLKDYEDVIIVGDRKCRFRDENVVLNRVDYIENGFKTIIKIISEAHCVITPISFWTTICNLQQTPVFSWGPQAGQHKEGGVYYFGNKKCWALPDINISTIIQMIEHFLKETFNGKKY